MPDPRRDDVLLWADVETSGLNPQSEYLLEVGLRVTDLDGELITDISCPINYPNIENIRNASVPFVQEMHDKNGLWEDCKNADPLHVVQNRLVTWCNDNDVSGMPLMGSSVDFDRSFINHKMDALGKIFHYRNINLSSIKELCRRLNPKLYDTLDEPDTDHRVWTCLDGSVKQYDFYRRYFLISGIRHG